MAEYNSTDSTVKGFAFEKTPVNRKGHDRKVKNRTAQGKTFDGAVWNGTKTKQKNLRQRKSIYNNIAHVKTRRSCKGMYALEKHRTRK